MATELGTAYLQIMPSAKGMKANMEKVIGGDAESAGASAGLKLAGKLKGVLAAAGIGAALKKTLDYGAELQQNLGGTEAVFGQHSEKLQNTAKSAYMNMGLSASDYMATANKMGSLFQGSGVSQVKSLEMTEAAMQRAADVASVMGIDTSMAMESIAGAAKGNFTMMDNLGVAMNATTLQAYALEKGVNFNWNTASNAEKAELAMQMFMDKTSQYQNNFARESKETLSGSFGALKAASQDFMANLTLGEGVQESMNNVVTTAITALGNLLPAVGNILSGLPGAISTAMETMHPMLMEGLANATEAIKANFPSMLANALQGLLNFSENLRGNAGQLVSAGLDMIKAIADGIIQNIPTIIQTVPTIISNFAGLINDNAPKILETGWSIMKSLAVGLVKAIPVIIENLPKILQAIWDVFTAFQWANLGKTLISGIGKGIKAAAKGIGNAVKSVVSGIKSAFSSGIGSAKTIVLRLFDGIKSGMTNKLSAARNTLKGIVDKIKGFFPLSIGKIFSNLKIPRINISGGKAPFGIGGLGTKPSISVSWNSKAMGNPYLFSNATLFGAGEAGDEVLYGRQRLMNDISTAVDKSTKPSGDINIYLNYEAGDDANDMLRDIARGVQRYKMAGVI